MQQRLIWFLVNQEMGRKHDQTLQIQTANENDRKWVQSIDDEYKGIRDAGSTADFRILFKVLKFKNLEI